MKLLLQYLALCFFANNPANLIPTKALMWKTVAFYLISGCIVEGLISDPADGSLEVFLRTIMAFSTVAVLLLMTKKWPYYNQLYTAIFICENFIMTLATITEAAYFAMVMKHHDAAEEISIAAGIFLVIWYIAIVSYIFRQMLLFPMALSIISAISYFVMTYGVPMLFMDL
jgi:hypothetical protein